MTTEVAATPGAGRRFSIIDTSGIARIAEQAQRARERMRASGIGRAIEEVERARRAMLSSIGDETLSRVEEIRRRALNAIGGIEGLQKSKS